MVDVVILLFCVFVGVRFLFYENIGYDQSNEKLGQAKKGARYEVRLGGFTAQLTRSCFVLIALCQVC